MKNKYLTAQSTTSATVQDFARYISSITSAKISGVFLERQDGGMHSVLQNINEMPLTQTAEVIGGGTGHACCGKCSKKNEEMLKPCGILQHNNGHKTTATIESIIHQSRFSDMMVLDAEMSFDAHQNGILSDETKTVLNQTECPVIIAPYSFSGIGEIVFAYDGSASAVFAIKQFTYLFPCFAEKKITVLQVNRAGKAVITHRNDMLELLQMHYSSIAFYTLNGTASESLFQYLSCRENAIVVLGSCASKPISDSYRQNSAEPLVKTINLPLFIAHQF